MQPWQAVTRESREIAPAASWPRVSPETSACAPSRFRLDCARRSGPPITRRRPWYRTTSWRSCPPPRICWSLSVFHGAGANKSERERIGLNIDYTLGWLRQEDNQYLSCPPEVAKDLDPKLQALLGYAMGGPSLGYFTPPLPAGEDLSAPKQALRPTPPVRLDADGRLEFVED